MVILSIALALALGGVAILMACVINLRARLRIQNTSPRKRSPKEPTSVITEYADDMEIPAALVGARCKHIIETLAPTYNLTPVNLLRATIATGLVGGPPLTEGILDDTDQEQLKSDLAPPSNRGNDPSRSN